MSNFNLPPGVSVMDPNINPAPIDEKLIQAFEYTYQTIAFDLPGDSITRDDLFDLCIDHVRVYGEMDEECLEYWDALSYDEKLSYMTIVFKYEEYETGNQF